MMRRFAYEKRILDRSRSRVAADDAACTTEESDEAAFISRNCRSPGEYADVGISLGSKSTDIAIETSDVVISRDDPMTIFEMRRLSQETMRIVKQNFAMVVGINTVGLILGASSNISVMMSALLHNMSTILVVGNSLRLLFFPPLDS